LKHRSKGKQQAKKLIDGKIAKENYGAV
jgi:hypothetical protein